MKYPAPTEPGLYLARRDTYRWWNLVARVHGEQPFLKVTVWDWAAQPPEVPMSEILGFVWGPKIDEPEIDRTDVKQGFW